MLLYLIHIDSASLRPVDSFPSVCVCMCFAVSPSLQLGALSMCVCIECVAVLACFQPRPVPTICTHSIRGRRTDWLPHRETTQAGVLAVVSRRARTASTPIRLACVGKQKKLHHIRTVGFCCTLGFFTDTEWFLLHTGHKIGVNSPHHLFLCFSL